jgi:hypothetical protein
MSLASLTDSSELCAHTVVSNALNLHRHALRQLLDSNAAASGLMCEVLLKDAVHLSEVCHVVEEDIDLDDLLNGCVGLLQDGNDVLAALCGLVGDATLDQGAGLVGGDLAGDEDLRTGDDGLGLGCVSEMICWNGCAAVKCGVDAGYIRSLRRRCSVCEALYKTLHLFFLPLSQTSPNCLISAVIVRGRARGRSGIDAQWGQHCGYEKLRIRT